jgi:hypothetical protein
MKQVALEEEVAQVAPEEEVSERAVEDWKWIQAGRKKDHFGILQEAGGSCHQAMAPSVLNTS